MLLWVVYIVRGFTPRLSLRFYVGCVRVLDGETWEQALERRRQEHSGPRKRALWLKICEGLVIEKEGDLCTSPVEARLAELYAVAKHFHLRGFAVRGGDLSAR